MSSGQKEYTGTTCRVLQPTKPTVEGVHRPINLRREASPQLDYLTLTFPNLKPRSSSVPGFCLEENVTTTVEQRDGNLLDIPSTSVILENSGNGVQSDYQQQVSTIDNIQVKLTNEAITVLKNNISSLPQHTVNEHTSRILTGSNLEQSRYSQLGSLEQTTLNKGSEVVSIDNTVRADSIQQECSEPLQVMVVEELADLGATVELSGDSSPKLVDCVALLEQGLAQGSSQVGGKELKKKSHKIRNP